MEALPLINIIFLTLGTFFVSLFVAAAGPTGGMQLATVAATMPASAVIPIHAWITGVAAFFRAFNLKEWIDWKYTLLFATTSIAASTIAVNLTLAVPIHYLSLILGLYILLSRIKSLVKERGYKRLKIKRPELSGAITGFLTVFIGATGPLLYSIMIDKFENKESLVATHSACLFFQHSSKVVLFGLISFSVFNYPEILALTLFAAWLGSFIGKRLFIKIKEKTYRNILTTILICISLIIIFQALHVIFAL